MYTIGVEEEFMICNPKTGDLIDRADLIMNSIKSEHLDRFSYELILSEIESNTSINDNVRDTVDEILKLRNMLKDIGNKSKLVNNSGSIIYLVSIYYFIYINIYKINILNNKIIL